MDLKSIKAIYRFIKSTDIVEIEVEGEGGKVRLKRGAPGSGEPIYYDPALQQSSAQAGDSASTSGGLPRGLELRE